MADPAPPSPAFATFSDALIQCRSRRHAPRRAAHGRTLVGPRVECGARRRAPGGRCALTASTRAKNERGRTNACSRVESIQIVESKRLGLALLGVVDGAAIRLCLRLGHGFSG